MRWLAALLSMFSAFAATPTAANDPLDSAILSAEGLSERTMVGDWEAPEVVVLVYGDLWLDTYHALLDTLSPSMPVVLLAEEGNSEEAQASLDGLSPAQRAQIWLPGYEVDSSWTRDYGPLQVRTHRGELVWIDAAYSAERPRDDDLPVALADWFGTEPEPILDTLDGGAVASNGQGLCVSTVEFFELADIELLEGTSSSMLEQLGCEVMALVPALAHERTKHIDLMLQFLGPDLAVAARFDPREDPEDARRADAAVALVRKAAARLGQPLTIARIDHPSAEESDYVSYVNFLQLADQILVPGYDSVDPEIEQAALTTLARLAPDRTVVRIPADEAMLHGGSIHCLTWGLHLP